MHFVTIRMNANTNSATIGEGANKVEIDRSKFKDNEPTTFREMIVDTWCKRAGYAPLYS